MARANQPKQIVRAARDLIAGDQHDTATANRVVMRALVDQLAVHRGLLPPDWPDLPTPVHPDTFAQAQEHLAGLDMTDWEVTHLADIYEDLIGRSGAWFTPDPLAKFTSRFSLDLALERLCDDHDPGSVLQVLAVDPSCGCGAFLVWAAKIIATEYAERLFGEATEVTLAIVYPEVLSETIFGMDIDPTCVDLCKAALWFLIGGEQPITFLDRNIICGDTLAGPHVQPPKLAERRGEGGQYVDGMTADMGLADMGLAREDT